MKKLLFTGLFLSIAAAQTGCAKDYVAYVDGVGDPRLPYMAIARVERKEAINIIYNSKICEDIGNACNFFKNHAYAHSMLRHQIFPNPNFYTQGNQGSADCWAAKYSEAEDSYAAYNLLIDETKTAELPIIGDPLARAEIIKTCSAENDRWLGT